MSKTGGRDEMRWDKSKWDEMRWDEMRWDEMREKTQKPTEWKGYQHLTEWKGGRERREPIWETSRQTHTERVTMVCFSELLFFLCRLSNRLVIFSISSEECTRSEECVRTNSHICFTPVVSGATSSDDGVKVFLFTKAPAATTVFDCTNNEVKLICCSNIHMSHNTRHRTITAT